MDHRNPGTRPPSDIIIPWSSSLWGNGNLAGLGSSGESLPVSGLLFPQCKTKVLHETFSEAFSGFLRF